MTAKPQIQNELKTMVCGQKLTKFGQRRDFNKTPRTGHLGEKWKI
jgi:hypothetical protein